MIRKKAKKRIPSSLENILIKEIKVVPLNSLKLWKDNPRKNTQAAKELAPILEKHGLRSPLVVWDKNNTIYKGNTTWKAAKLLGWKNIAVAFVSFKSEEAANAYGIADNKSQEFSEWDDELLNKMLDTEPMKKFYGSTGFTEKELNGILFESNLDDIKETSDGMSGIITISCPIEKRDAVFDFINKVVIRKFPKDITIK